jgi:hypothetical protein
LGVISVSLPADGTTADVGDYNTPMTTVVNEINGNLDDANIKSGAAIVFSKISGGTVAALAAYASTTPTYVNFALGNGTVSAYYNQIGKKVHYYGVITLGSTSSVSGQMDISLPVNATSTIGDFAPIGTTNIRDTSANTYYPGFAWKADGAQRLRVIFTVASGTYSTAAGTTSSVPFTWATSDLIFWDVTYEAA